MKQIHFLILLLLTVILTSCSNDDDQIVFEQNDYLNTNNIGDVAKIYTAGTVLNDSSLCIIYGNRNQHDWFGLFDIDSKLLKKEWIGMERLYKPKDIFSTNPYSSSTFKKTENNNFTCTVSFDYTIDETLILYDNGSIKYIDKKGVYVEAINEDLLLYWDTDGDNDNRYICNSDGELYATACSKTTANLIKTGECINIYSGFKGDYFWIATDYKNHISEAISSQKYERERKIDLGYGEFIDVKIDHVWIHYDNFVTSDNSLFLVYPNEYFSDLFILKGNKIDCIQLEGLYNVSFREWYNNSILLDTYVLNTKGEVLERLSPNIKYMKENAVAVSYTDIIEFKASCYMTRRDMKTYDTIWQSKIEKLENIGDARINYSVIEQTDSYIISKCDITHRDGKKESISFKTMIDSGEIIML